LNFELNYEERGAVALVWLDRPEKRNALSRPMLERLAEVFSGMRERRDLRAVILTGRGGDDGDGAFSAGMDIAELAALGEEEARRAAERGQKVCELIETCPVPVIAAVNGVAAGGGCELALACHLRVASTSARFSLPETKPEVIPAYGGTRRLARIIGERRALAVMLAGESLAADEALSCGLVNRVVASAELLSEAETLARFIVQHAPLAVRACLEAVTRGAHMPLEDGLQLEAELFSRLFATQDVREGTRAFLEKRQPVFKGE